MQITRVGIREFRENLSNYLESKTPVAITRHGATIGIYIPTKPKPSHADLEALRAAGEKIQALIAAAGTTKEEIVADFKKLRRERRPKEARQSVRGEWPASAGAFAGAWSDFPTAEEIRKGQAADAPRKRL